MNADLNMFKEKLNFFLVGISSKEFKHGKDEFRG